MIGEVNINNTFHSHRLNEQVYAAPEVQWWERLLKWSVDVIKSSLIFAGVHNPKYMSHIMLNVFFNNVKGGLWHTVEDK